MPPSRLGDEYETSESAAQASERPSEAVPGDDSRVRRTLWSLSWPTVAMVLGILAWLAFSAISKVVTHYQNVRNGSWAAISPLATPVTSVNIWRAVGYLVPLAVAVVLTVLASWFVFVQRRRVNVEATRWKRVVVGLATIWLIGFGLWIAGESLTGTVSGTPDVWLVRTAGCILGLLVAGAALYVLRSKAFRLSVWTYLVGLPLIVVMTLSAYVANTTDQPLFGDWSSTGFTSLTYVAKGASYWATDCPDSFTCIAEGLAFGPKTAIAISSDSGRSWVRHVSTSPAPVIAWLSCWDANHCVGARGGTVITSDGGKSWQSANVPPSFSSQSVECNEPGMCIAVGSFITPVTTPGHPAPPPSAEVLVTHDGGVTWTAGALPPGTWDLYSVTCATSSHCFATGTLTRVNTSPGVILQTQDGGLTWSDTNAPVGAPLLSQMSCGDAEHCVAVGSTRTANVPQTSVAVWTSAGGATWGLSQIPGHNNIIRVACAGADRCLAAGQGPQRSVIFDSNDGGATWQANAIRFPSESEFNATQVSVSCAQVGFCMAVSGTYATTSMDGGVTWHRVK